MQKKGRLQANDVAANGPRSTENGTPIDRGAEEQEMSLPMIWRAWCSCSSPKTKGVCHVFAAEIELVFQELCDLGFMLPL